MIHPALIAILVGIILYRVYKFVFGKPDNFPPGPPRLPYVGSYFFLTLTNYNHIHRATETLSKYYNTKILGCYYKNTPLMVIHDLEICREVFNNNALDNRATYDLVKTRSPERKIHGIFFTDGEIWRDQRRFSVRYLRDFGFGRRSQKIEAHMNDELLDMIDLFKSGPKHEHEYKYWKDGAFLFPFSFAKFPANMFFQIAMNRRYERKDSEIVQRAAEGALGFQLATDPYGRLFSLIPFSKYILPNGSGYKLLRKASMGLFNLFEEIILQEYETYDPSCERHFLDSYFKDMKERKNNTRTIEQLVQLIVDYTFPPLSAMSIQLAYLFQRFMMHPDILAKCQVEIDRVVEKCRLPTLDDRKSLSYTEACIRESLRLETITVNGVPHVASRDTKIDKYDCPAGTMIITNLQVAHEDEKYFADALKFKPDRFLNEHGELDVKLDKTLAFGAGNRVCAGTTFARSVLFLITATIVQKFNFHLPDGHKLHDPMLEEHPSGFAKCPLDFYIKFEER